MFIGQTEIGKLGSSALMEITGKVSCKINICNVTQNYKNRKANNLQFWFPFARNTEPTIQSQNGNANNSRNPFEFLRYYAILFSNRAG